MWEEDAWFGPLGRHSPPAPAAPPPLFACPSPAWLPPRGPRGNVASHEHREPFGSWTPTLFRRQEALSPSAGCSRASRRKTVRNQLLQEKASREESGEGVGLWGTVVVPKRWVRIPQPSRVLETKVSAPAGVPAGNTLEPIA